MGDFTTNKALLREVGELDFVKNLSIKKNKKFAKV